MKRETTLGSTAVDGLLAGITAGLVMVIYLVLIGLLSGEGVIIPLERFSPTQPGNLFAGVFTHLAVSGVYGMLFGILHQILKRWSPNWLLGMGYGMALFLMAQFVLLPGAASPLLEIPTLHFALAHLLYGAVLGVRVQS